MNLGNAMLSERSQAQIETILFHLYEVTVMETDSRMMVFRE
jgi:hypothetical protein